MKAKISEKPAPFFRALNGVVEAPLAELPVGTELDCGDVRDARLFSGRQCLPARLSDGQRGYIYADTLVIHLKEVALMADRVPLYEGPSFDAGVVTKLGKYTRGFLLETVERDGKKWNRIRVVKGKSRLEGYVEMVTPVRVLPAFSKAAGRQLLFVALRWWAAAIAVGLLGSAYDLAVVRTCMFASVPLFYAMRFTIVGAWNVRGAPV